MRASSEDNHSLGNRRYFFAGEGDGLLTGNPVEASSMEKLQCVSTFFPPEVAVMMTEQFLSFSFCVT